MSKSHAKAGHTFASTIESEGPRGVEGCGGRALLIKNARQLRASGETAIESNIHRGAVVVFTTNVQRECNGGDPVMESRHGVLVYQDRGSRRGRRCRLGPRKRREA